MVRQQIGAAPDIAVYLSTLSVWPGNVLVECNAHSREGFTEQQTRSCLHHGGDRGGLELVFHALDGHTTRLVAFIVRVLPQRLSLSASFYPPRELFTEGAQVSAAWPFVELQPRPLDEPKSFLDRATSDMFDPWN